MNNSNFPVYGNNSTLFFTKLLEQNQNCIIKAYEAQNSDNIEESISFIEDIERNFGVLGLMADQFAYTPELIQENRELLSQAHVDTIYDKFPTCEINKTIHTRTNKKPKQLKIKWSEQEQRLFIEGLEKYGNKNLKKVSDYIGTRNVGQVRSHLQKHLIKEKRLKEKKDSETEL